MWSHCTMCERGTLQSILGMLKGQEHHVPLWVTARSLKLKHWNKKKKEEIQQGQISLSPSLSNQSPSGLAATGPRKSLALCWLKHPPWPPVDTALSARLRRLCYFLTYRRCLASSSRPSLARHYDTLRRWQSAFQREVRKVAERRREPRWTGGRRQGGKVLRLRFILRVAKRVTIDLIICII